MKTQDWAEVIYLLGSRKRMLLLIEAKVQDDEELRALVRRCATCEYALGKEVTARWGGF